MIRFPKTLTLISLALILANSYSALHASSDAQLKPELPLFIKKLTRQYRIESDDISFSVIELETGEEVQSFNATRAMVPASLMKVPTCLFALASLGAQKKFPTQVLAHGLLDKGVLKGDLVLKGHGDPSLTAARLHDLALRLSLKGVTEIKGDFYYDETAFPKTYKISDLGLGDQTYNPGIGPLNIEFNRIRLYKDKSNASTFRALFKTIPTLDFLKIQKVKTPLSAQQDFIWHTTESETSEVWQLSTKKNYGRFESLPVRNPGLYAAQLFRLYAFRQGIELPEAKKITKEKAEQSYSTLVQSNSRPLIEICEMALEYSNNLYAEALLLTSAKAMQNDLTSLKQAGSIMSKWFKQRYPDINWEGTHFQNGSGLSLRSRLSAHALTQVLNANHDRVDRERSFWSLLSLSGQSGWLKNRLFEKGNAHRVFAKTGSLDFVHNIAGYFISHDNKRYAFTLMVSDIKKRRKAENLKATSAAYQKLYRQGRTYRSNARALSNELIEHWLQQL